MKTKRASKTLSLLLALCMVVSLLPTVAYAAEGEYHYIDEYGENQTVSIDSANVIDGSWAGVSKTLTAGWYVVTETVTVAYLAVTGDVKLILSDGAALTVSSSGIYLASGNSLTIYGQSGGTGSLTASSDGYAIGYGYGGGALAIYGGAVNAQGDSAGINVNELIIHNGTLTVFGSDAILAGAVTISGGAVTAHSTCSDDYYGIGATGTLTISGGTVKTTGGQYGLRSFTNNIVIDGGSVDAVTFNAQPKNSDGTPVYKSTLLLPEAGPGASVSGTVSSAGYYSFDGVKTDGEGRACLWLPAGEPTVALTAGSKTYTGTFTVKDDNSTLWPLAARTVTFDPKGGTMTDPTTAQTGAETFKLAALPAEPTLEGYTFDGWYSDYYGGEKITTDTVFYLDATVYARWNAAGGGTTDTRNIDVSRLTVDHTEAGVWSYSAADKTLAVPAADGRLTLTGENNDLQVNVTGAGVTLVLSDAAISAGGEAVTFSSSAGESTLELAADTVNTLGGRLYSERKLILSGTGGLTVTDAMGDWTEAAITVYSASLVIDGPDVVANGYYFGLIMGGSGGISTGELKVQSGSLTLDRTYKHYSQTLDSNYTGSLTVNVGSGASFTVLNGDTMPKTIINNNGGTVYIDGNVAGTANNNSGTFTVTGAVASSTGTITKPALPEVEINLSALEAGGTEYYELIDGSTIPDGDKDDLPLAGYTVIKIKKPAQVTLTGTAPAGHVLWDRNTTSEYILNSISIDGLAYFAFKVTVTGVNTVDSFGIAVAGGNGGACTYSGGGTLTVQNSAGKNPYGAFPAYPYGTAVIDGCTVEISGFARASSAIQVKSGALTADGSIKGLEMDGGSADVWNLYNQETIVDYSGGALALFGRLDVTSAVPGISVTFESNGGSDMPGLYLYGINSYTMAAPESPVKTGSAFDGWHSDAALTQPVAFPLAVTTNAVYYANWRASSISITRQPQDITVILGETGELSVEVEGGTPNYQWYSTNQNNANYFGTKLEGATSGVYTVPATLDVNTYYYYYCKITAGQDVIHSERATVIVKLPQAAPDAPTLGSKTATSVTLSGMGSSYEYRCDTGAWQKSNVFSGLSPDTEYTFYLRLSETNYNAPSPAGPGLTVTTEQAALAGAVSIDGTPRYGETLQAYTSALTIGGDPVSSGILRYQWQRSGGDAVIGTASTYTLTAADIGYTITLTVTADGCPGASAATSETVGKGVRTPPPAPTGSYTGDGFNFTYTVDPVDGVRYGVKRADGAYTWIAGNVFTGHSEGSVEFYLRYLATDIYLESGDSAPLSVTFVKLNHPQAPPLNYTVSGESDNRTITITEVTGAEYKFGDADWGSASSKGGYDSASGAVTIQIRYAETYTHHASAAASAQVSPGKESQSAPPAFTLGYEGVDDLGYTVTIPLTDGAEYSFDGIDYSGVNTKTDCLPGQTVTGYKRMAATDAYNASPSTRAEVTLPLFQVKTPTAAPNGGTFTTSQSVTLATATAGAEIRYTTNGSTPTASSTLYTDAISLTDTTTIKAIAVKSGMADSAVLTVTFAKSGGGSDNGGSGGSTTPPAPTAPTTSGGTATTSVTPTVTNGTASAAVTNAQVNSAIEAAKAAAEKSGEKPGVEIAISGASGADATAATLPRASVQALANGGIDALTVSGPVATVRFDSGALATINAAAGDVTVAAARVEAGALPEAARAIVGDHPVYDFSVTSGGKAISSFGGTVTVSIPYTPAAGEDTANLVIYYISDSGSVERIPNARYDAATGTIIFTTDHFSYYAVGYEKILFTDVQPGAWYYAAVNFIAEKGITTGTGNGKFSPDATLTRGQFITMLLRAYDIETDATPADNFSDAGNTYYTGYLAAAKRLGISSGVGDNKFAPEQAITRQEMFTLLYNALKVIGALPDGNSGRTLSDFTDSGDIASWASEALTALVKSGTVSGNNGKLDPKDTTTRAQMAQVLYNLLGK